MIAVMELTKAKREELHDYERPISYLAFQKAEMNRDRKKRNKPFKVSEFYFYESIEQQNLPEPRYGAAALKLIELGQFPHWALFTFKDLKARAADALAPELLCYQCEDAIVLAPEVNGHEVYGMLIASKTASEGVREMVSPCGARIMVRMPALPDKFQADEEAVLRLMA